MKIVKDPKQLSGIVAKLRERHKRIGFVPTMGFLHEGHLSLVARALRENDIVIVSIFVNPTQFGPREDFNRYPRSLSRDKRLLKQKRVDFLFVPDKNSIYKKNCFKTVHPGPLAGYLCGPKRPGHFRGVATVVKRLFDITCPHNAYFGEKDFQQLRIIEEMVKRLRLPVQIKRVPIVRESDGLAMSSRNRYLSKHERLCAKALYQSLKVAHEMVVRGEKKSDKVIAAMQKLLLGKVDQIDYIKISNPSSLRPLKHIRKSALIALACTVGPTRLIDNILIKG